MNSVERSLSALFSLSSISTTKTEPYTDYGYDIQQILHFPLSLTAIRINYIIWWVIL